VVDPNDDVLGYVCGVVEAEAPKLVKQTEPAALRALASRPWLWLHRDLIGKVQARAWQALGRPQNVVPSLPGPTMYLYAIGVADAARGQGVAQRLLHAFEEQARAAGMGSMVLSVFLSNTAAIAAYQRAGWSRTAGKHFGGAAAYFEKVL
jgi:ribosomal protein S18 acetylase RimI-like enzyme